MNYFDGDLVHEAALPGLIRNNSNIVEPNANIYDSGDKFILKLEMPGILEKDINMSTDDNGELTITCKRDVEHGLLLKEYERCTFKRSLTLPKGVTLGTIKTEYVNGIFIVYVPQL